MWCRSVQGLLRFSSGLLVGISLIALGQTAAPSPSSTSPGKDAGPATQNSQNTAGQNQDPLKRPISEEEKKEHAKNFKKEVGSTYKKWLDEDVVYIITDEEKQTFKQLSNDEERDNFIENFWYRRNPNPDSLENEYKEEHYRRIAYANEHFAAGKPGWRSDRGRIYITYGPADEVNAHPAGGTYNRPQEEGGGTTSTFPYEDWRYRYLEGVGQNIEIEFVDDCMCGDYRMTMDRGAKDALLHTPGGQTLYESMGLSTRAQTIMGNGMESIGAGSMTALVNSQEFNRLQTYAKLQQPPPVKFKDLEEVVTTKITYNMLPFDVRADFVRITSDTVLVPVTIQVQNKDVTFVKKDDVQRGTINIFGRVTSVTGRIIQTFEDTVQIDSPAELFEKVATQASVYWKALPLKPGRYRVDIVLKDVNGDRKGTWSKGIVVPDFGEDKLASSSLIIADVMEKVASRQVGTANFVIGDTKVRPRVEPSNGSPASFKRSQNASFWMQVYNLSVDEKTHKPDATIEYDVENLATPDKPVVHRVEETSQMGNIGEQLTLEKSLPLTSFQPGTYRVRIKVYDKLSKQELSPTPTARFIVE